MLANNGSSSQQTRFCRALFDKLYPMSNLKKSMSKLRIFVHKIQNNRIRDEVV